MHDLSLFIANEHVDRRVINDASLFHAQSHNRHITPYSQEHGLHSLSHDQISFLEYQSYDFGGVSDPKRKKCPVSNSQRSFSASSFVPHSPLRKCLFDRILSESFSESEWTSPKRLIRPYPSAGALYSAQITIYCRNIQGVSDRVYHYLPNINNLELLHEVSHEDVLEQLLLTNKNPLANFHFLILYSFIASVPISKYGYRGYRFGVLEIGSMYQKLLTVLDDYGLCSRVWGGFYDEPLSALFGVDPRVSWPVICQLAGRS